jgi:hypothetical protein
MDHNEQLLVKVVTFQNIPLVSHHDMNGNRLHAPIVGIEWLGSKTEVFFLNCLQADGRG